MATSKPRRRTQEERSEDMQRRILDAAFELLRERGYVRFTTAEVAKRAKVSRGALVHHFSSKAALVSAAMEHVFSMSLASGLARADEVAESDDPIGAVLDDAFAFYFSDYFYVGLDMLLAGAKDEDLKEQGARAVRNYRQPVEDEWRRVLLRAGLSPKLADEVLWLTVDLVRGSAIRALWRHEPERIEACLRTWRDMTACYIKQAQAREGDDANGEASSAASGDPR